MSIKKKKAEKTSEKKILLISENYGDDYGIFGYYRLLSV